MALHIKERIGDPALFTNRQEDFDFLNSWVGRIEKEAALSTAITSHRKVGKTALLQRLYNRLFEQGGKSFPFYSRSKNKTARWMSFPASIIPA